MLVSPRPPRARTRLPARRQLGHFIVRATFVTVLALSVLVADPTCTWAVADIPTVINNLRNWIIGMLAGLATLFLTFGGLRYLTAGGDPGEVEAAKRALKAAAVGYVLAVLAPVIVAALQGIVGADGGGQ